MQTRDKVLTVTLPWLGHSPICPVACYPAQPNDPLLRIPRSHGVVPLTYSVARKI